MNTEQSGPRITRNAAGTYQTVIKPAGRKLYAELAAGNKPAVVRSILKILEGMALKSESENRESGKIETALAREFSDRLDHLGHDTARRIVKMVDAELTRREAGARALPVESLYRELRGEFEPGALRFIIAAAQRLAKRAA